MKKGIQASLYLPKECLDIIQDNSEEVLSFFDSFASLDYDIYLAEYNGEEVCGIEFVILEDTASNVEESYKSLKQFLKYITNKQPIQILKLKFDRI